MYSCVNKFVLIIVRRSSPILLRNIAHAVTEISTKEDFTYYGLSAQIFGLCQNEYGVVEDDDYVIFVNGVLLDNISDILKFGNIPIFLKKYDSQAVLLIADKTHKKIYAIRDPFGTRTIFFYLNNDLLVISSDIMPLASLIRKLGYNLNVDMLTIYEFLIFNALKTNRTLFKEIKQICAGEFLSIDLLNNEVTLDQYYKPYEVINVKEFSDVEEVLRTIASNLEHLLKTLSSDHCLIGIPVSGGLDTSTILSLVLRLPKSNRIKVIPVFIDIDNEYERTLTKSVCTKFGVNYISRKYDLEHLKYNYFRLLREALFYAGIPQTGDASLPYVFLADFLKSIGVKFALSGDGGDGIFGGYDCYRIHGVKLIKQGRLNDLFTLIRHVALTEAKQPFKVFLEILFFSFLSSKIPQVQYFTLKRNFSKIFPQKHLKRLFNTILTYLWSISKNKNEYMKHFIIDYSFFKFPEIGGPDVKYHEQNEVILYFPFMSKNTLNSLLKLPDYLFFYPYGVRSIQRVLLKVMGFPEQVYLQRKSGFSTTNFMLKDKHIIANMIKELRSNELLSRLLNIENLKYRKPQRNYFT